MGRRANYRTNHSNDLDCLGSKHFTYPDAILGVPENGDVHNNGLDD
jgi:hypothetical protein